MKNRLKEIARLNGWTALELAQKIGISKPGVNKYYVQVSQPTAAAVEQYAKILGIHPLEIWDPGPGFRHAYDPSGAWAGIIPINS